MTHTAYTIPPQTTTAINVPINLSNSRIFPPLSFCTEQRFARPWRAQNPDRKPGEGFEPPTECPERKLAGGFEPPTGGLSVRTPFRWSEPRA
jgi:hypothetical protein